MVREAARSVNVSSLALLWTRAFASTNVDDLFILVGFFPIEAPGPARLFVAVRPGRH
jgi:hypothetical protein